MNEKKYFVLKYNLFHIFLSLTIFFMLFDIDIPNRSLTKNVLLGK